VKAKLKTCQALNCLKHIYPKRKNYMTNKILLNELKKRKDEFLPGLSYVKKWNYVIDATETVPYVKINYQGLPILDTSSGYPSPK
jgi:hypothetical protein